MIHARFAHPKTNTDALGVKKGMAVADFGAGSGAYVFHLAEQVGESGRVYAVDVQQDLLRRIVNEAQRRNLPNVMTIRADLEKEKSTNLPPASIDLVLLSNILFQLEDKHAIFHEAKRILKPSGILAVIDWNESYGGLGPRSHDVVHKHAAGVIAGECGFTVRHEFSAGAHHYGLIMKMSEHLH